MLWLGARPGVDAAVEVAGLCCKPGPSAASELPSRSRMMSSCALFADAENIITSLRSNFLSYQYLLS